jgi:hypothetical protein
MLNRIKGSLILAPAILLLLCLIGRFAGSEELLRVGMGVYVIWAAATSLVVGYVVTVYVSFVAHTWFRR